MSPGRRSAAPAKARSAWALDGPEGFDKLKSALSADPRLTVDVQNEQDYFSGQTKRIPQDDWRAGGDGHDHHGARRGFRGTEQHVCRGGGPRQGDRHAARDRLRRSARCWYR